MRIEMVHYRKGKTPEEPIRCKYENADFTVATFTDVEPSGLEYGIAVQISTPCRTEGDIPDWILRAAHFSLADYRKKNGIEEEPEAL